MAQVRNQWLLCLAALPTSVSVSPSYSTAYHSQFQLTSRSLGAQCKPQELQCIVQTQPPVEKHWELLPDTFGYHQQRFMKYPFSWLCINTHGGLWIILEMNITNQLYPAVSKEEAIPQSLAACSLNAWGKRWSTPCGKGSTDLAGEPISLPSGYVKIAIENHHFLWVNQLLLWPFSIAMLNYQRVSSNDLQKDTEKITNEEHDESIIGEFQLPSDYQ